MSSGVEHIPTPAKEQKVYNMSVLGYSQMDIANSIGVSVPTLKSKYKKQMVEGKELLIGGAAQVVAKHVQEGNLQAALAILKCKGDWREKQEVELSSPENKPLQIEYVKPGEA